MEPIEKEPSSEAPTPARLAHGLPDPGPGSLRRPELDWLLTRYSEGALSWREVSDSTDLAYGEVLVELGKRNLAQPRVSPKRRPEQDALFECALRGANCEAGRHG